MDMNQESQDQFESSARLLEPNEKKLWSGRSTKKRSQFAKAFVIHLTVLTLYTLGFLLLWNYTSPLRTAKPDELYSVASHVFKPERKVFYLGLDDDNPYKGKPRPELDAAWRDLVAPTAFRFPTDGLKRLNRTSLPIGDGNGHMVTLDVYHQLHCIKLFRQYIHPEYYTINQTRIEDHIDHCLDGIRQYLMCHADAAPNTYEWIPDYERPWPVFKTEHQCINWESFHSWALENSFNGFDEKLITHPSFNPDLLSPYYYKIDKSNMPMFDQLRAGPDVYTNETKAHHFLE